MVPLRDVLPNLLHQHLQLLRRLADPTLNKLQLGRERCAQLRCRCLVLRDATERVGRFGVSPYEVVLPCDGAEYIVEVHRPVFCAHKKTCMVPLGVREREGEVSGDSTTRPEAQRQGSG